MSAIRDEMLEILQRERACLVAGDFDRLSRLTDLKLSIFERIREADGGRLLRTVIPELKRNDAILEATMAGLRGAKDQIRSVRENLGKLSVYGADGHRQDIVTRTSQVSRSA